MATSEKLAAAKLQEAWNLADERVHYGQPAPWKVIGSPGLGNWFAMIAPDGTRFHVYVDQATDTRTTAAGADREGTG